jgi:hypothetical protein
VRQPPESVPNRDVSPVGGDTSSSLRAGHGRKEGIFGYLFAPRTAFPRLRRAGVPQEARFWLAGVGSADLGSRLKALNSFRDGRVRVVTLRDSERAHASEAESKGPENAGGQLSAPLFQSRTGVPNRRRLCADWGGRDATTCSRGRQSPVG